MSASHSSAESGLSLLREGLIRHEKEHADVKKKLSESQGELQRVRQQVRLRGLGNNPNPKSSIRYEGVAAHWQFPLAFL